MDLKSKNWWFKKIKKDVKADVEFLSFIQEREHQESLEKFHACNETTKKILKADCEGSMEKRIYDNITTFGDNECDNTNTSVSFSIYDDQIVMQVLGYVSIKRFSGALRFEN